MIEFHKLEQMPDDLKNSINIRLYNDTKIFDYECVINGSSSDWLWRVYCTEDKRQELENILLETVKANMIVTNCFCDLHKLPSRFLYISDFFCDENRVLKNRYGEML